MDQPGPPALHFDVRERADGTRFDAPADQVLLLSALAAGRPWESSCRNGTCRACIRQLFSGSVRYRIPWPGLLPEEKAQGWILPCVALPESDLELQ
jgi:ferredoxin